MKFLIAISALLTVASGLIYHPYAFGGKSAPCVNAANVPVPCAGAPYAYHGLPYALGRKKREADAYGFYGYPLGLKSAPCVNAANVPVPCAAGHFSHLGYYGHGHGKREADAEPAYLGLGYHGLGYAGLGYAGLGYAGLGHAAVATPAGLVHSSHVGLCTNYLGAAVPCKKKREAEADAEADPAIVYSGLGYGGLGYAGLGYAGLGYAGLGYAGLGHVAYAAPAVLAAAPAVVAAAPAVVAPVATVHNAVLGTADLPNPVHGVAHTLFGTVHSSHVGVCTNYLGEQVSC